MPDAGEQIASGHWEAPADLPSPPITVALGATYCFLVFWTALSTTRSAAVMSLPRTQMM